MLKKEISLYDRNDKGILIPKEVPLLVDEKDLEECPELAEQTISVIPLTRGEIKVLFSNGDSKEVSDSEDTSDTDGELILKHCKSPVYDKDEIEFIKPAYTRAIVKTILEESGIIIGKSVKGKKSHQIKEDEFGKH